MFSLIKTIGLKKLLATEMPSFVLSLILAETLYKFGSFILECLAFLVTWGLISYLINEVLAVRKNQSQNL